MGDSDNKKNVKQKKKKSLNNLPIGIFNRLKFHVVFEEHSMVIGMESILDTYDPLVLSSCDTSSYIPKNPLDIAAFRSATNLPGRKPYLQLPKLPESIPAVSRKNKCFIQPPYPSLIPVLMTAKFCGTDIRRYHIVTRRNSLRGMATKNEDFVVNVVRFGSTLFLRRFSRHRTCDKNDLGFRFEGMCTTNKNKNSDFNQLIGVQIRNYRILIMGETDAIDPQNGASIELKSKKSNVSNSNKHDWWLQAFLCGTKTIIHGQRAAHDDSIVTDFRQYDTSTLSNRQAKNQTLDHLHSILDFLFSNVAADRSYMLRGCKDETTNQRTIKLYEIIDLRDKEKLTFITSELLQNFFVDQ